MNVALKIDDDFDISRGKRIKKAIADKGLKQNEVAMMMGRDTSAISKWCAGHPVTEVDLKKIAGITDKSLPFLRYGVMPHCREDFQEIVQAFEEMLEARRMTLTPAKRAHAYALIDSLLSGLPVDQRPRNLDSIFDQILKLLAL